MYVREGRRLPQIVRRHFGKISGVAAVALAGAAIAAPEASAVNVPPPGGVTSNQCIGETFGRSDVKQTCVVDLQVLVTNLGYGPLTADGIYGPLTAAAVEDFNLTFGDRSNVVYPSTWISICRWNASEGFEGAYWHGAGCQSVA